MNPSLKSLFVMAVLAAGAGASAQAPSALADNGFRGELSLNGVWTRSIEGVSSELQLPGNPPSKEGQALFSKRVSLPPSWRGRELSLELGNCGEDAEILVDGVKLADLKKRKRFVEFPLPAKLSGSFLLELRSAGTFKDGLLLRSKGSSSASIDESYISTSVREGRVALRLSGRGPAGAVLAVSSKVSAEPGGKPLKTLSAQVRCDASGLWSCETSVAWPDAERWSRFNPKLHYYEAVLSDSSGAPLDKLLPRSFGFREVWIENGQLLLNGIQTNYLADNSLKPSGDFQTALRGALAMKAAGFSSFYGDVDPDLTDAAGFLRFQNCGSVVRLNVWDPKNGFTEMTGSEDCEDIVRLVKRLREHPSLIGWTSACGYSQASMHPELNGRKFETWDFFPLNRSREESRKAQFLFKDLQGKLGLIDPTRPVSCANGPFTQIDHTTRYLCSNLDRQEMAEFFENWFRSDFKQVIAMGEIGVPFASEFQLRRIDFELAQSKIQPKVYLEAAARYLGPSAYLRESDAELRRFASANGFEGLEDSDLAYWSGSSDLQPSVTAITPAENRFPERLWHVGNSNAVASRTFIRPQTGACRALAVSGFDLQESPLLETTRGKGRIVFCQFDVTNRYGKDPAATRLLDNLLRYLLQAPDADPAKGELAPLSAPVEKVGNLLRGALPEGSAAWGVTPGELFFREALYELNFGMEPKAEIHVFADSAKAPFPQLVRRAKDGRFECSLDESSFKTGWGKRKASWLRSALVVNQGGSRLDGPALSLQGRATPLYQAVWVEGFVHPYASNIW